MSLWTAGKAGLSAGRWASSAARLGSIFLLLFSLGLVATVAVPVW